MLLDNLIMLSSLYKESLGDAVITAGARLVELDLCDNAFGPDGVKAVTKLLTSPSCFSLKILKFNNNGLGIGGGKVCLHLIYFVVYFVV